MSNSVFPPDTFNRSKNAFRPAHIGPSEQGLELANKVAGLKSGGRLRSAMDVIFGVLTREPNDQVALRLAMEVVGTTSRTSGLEATEPLTPEYLYDRRLDPIFAVCSKCERSSWVPTKCLRAFDMPEMEIAVSSPIGCQCYDCGYVVCRKCMPVQRIDTEMSIVSRVCLNCGKTDVRPTVYPTGRLPAQLSRTEGEITLIIIFREGPVVPGGEYIKELLKGHCPDALRGGTRIKAVPVENWPDKIEMLARFYVLNLHKKDTTVGYFRGVAEFRDPSGVRSAIVKLCATEA
jgi:hypothetical protein